VPEENGRIPGLVSIVTACLDGGAYLDTTIQSVLAQTYRSVEYILVDGGSTDASLSIAAGFGDRIVRLMLPKSSQTEATNAGFRASRGEFFAFLGADDVLAPNAIEKMVEALRERPTAPFVYADAEFIGTAGDVLGSYPTRDFDARALAEYCYVCQPATLIRSDVFGRANGLAERYDAAFDYDLWIRLAHTEPPPVRLPLVLAGARMHYQTKTYRTRRQNVREIRRVVRRHYGYVPFSWIHAYAGLALTDCDMFFDPPRGSLQRTLLTLFVGLADNRSRPLAFVREYLREVCRLRREKRAGSPR
jgi:glycosyltransferase involved in cell wall biosynthesis